MARPSDPDSGPATARSPSVGAAVAAGTASTAATADPGGFEPALTELERIVQQMEGGALTLEQSLAAYRRGAELVGGARKALAEVEQQVRILEADVLKPFDSGKADDA